MKELEDYSWFPSILRNFQTAYIGFVVSTFNVYGVFTTYIKSLPLELGALTDLCSGSGEPAIGIFKQSNCFSHLVLTDKYPNSLAVNIPHISYNNQSVDIREMEFRKDTYYTMFNAFHHFTEKEKVNMAKKIQASGSTAFVVEILEPTLLCFLKVFFSTTIGCLLLTPFVYPFSWTRLLFTYLIPVNIFTITYDGMVSVLKSRSVKYYQNLFGNGAIKIFRLKSTLNALVVIQIEPIK